MYDARDVSARLGEQTRTMSYGLRVVELLSSSTPRLVALDVAIDAERRFLRFDGAGQTESSPPTNRPLNPPPVAPTLLHSHTSKHPNTHVSILPTLSFSCIYLACRPSVLPSFRPSFRRSSDLAPLHDRFRQQSNSSITTD